MRGLWWETRLQTQELHDLERNNYSQLSDYHLHLFSSLALVFFMELTNSITQAYSSGEAKCLWQSTGMLTEEIIICSK